MNWLWPDKGPKHQVTAALKNISFNIKTANHRIKIPIICLSTYWEIVNNLLGSKPNTSLKCKYLQVNKNNSNIRKNVLKNILIFALSVCPACQTSNCAFSCNSKKITINKRTFIECVNCHRVFKTRYDTVDCNNYKTHYFRKCLAYECFKCKNMFENIYAEFLTYLTIMKPKPDNDYSTPKKVFDNLSESAKKQLNYNYESLYYAIKVVHNRGVAIIPPLAFLVETNKQVSFYEKLLNNNETLKLDAKTKYGSVNSRAKGGKNSFFRSCALNKRYVLSARVIIVPNKMLEPNQCILPIELFRRLNCPKVIAGHRYPTLDVRSVTYHRVVGTWKYPCLGISTAVVSGNNADFDGDCLHIIPVTSLQSRAELEYLCNPKYNMIVQNQLRVKFDHDEIQTIYSQFGLNSQQIHDALLNYARNTSSPEAYGLFCRLRKFCHHVWEYHSYIPTVTFTDFLEIYNLYQGCDGDYQRFVDRVYPAIRPENGIKELIASKSSRFSIDHLWQIYGEINVNAKMGFLEGMDKLAFIKMAMISREAIIKDVAYFGYAHIKLTHCTKTVLVGYDGKLYTTDGLLVCGSVEDFFGRRKK